MKNNKCCNGQNWLILFLWLILFSCIALFIMFVSANNLKNDLNDCKKSDSFYQEYSNDYVKQYGQCESHLNECNSDLEFVMSQCDKMAVMCDKELFLAKDKCPICPVDEVCIKLVKENKFQCINRELIGGN